MNRPTESLEPCYFDAVYAANPDPWQFASSPYERGKYAMTLAALPNARYAAGLEIGCSIGVFTQQLALRCDNLLALDVAVSPLTEARQRCASNPTVSIEQMFVPAQWPAGAFDLIVLSEVVYYLSAADVARLASRVTDSLVSKGDIILVHWTGATDYPLTGDEAAELFMDRMDKRAKVLWRERHQGFRIDVLTHH